MEELASTTGNIYGVYDMNGGAWEYTMAYITSGHEYLTTYGGSFASADSDEGNTSYRATSTKYATAYPQGISTTIEVGIETGYTYWNTTYGDAIAEVSIGNPNTTTSCLTIYEDTIEFDKNTDAISSREPFFPRGGDYGAGSTEGVFGTIDNSGGGYNGTYSYRVVLI